MNTTKSAHRIIMCQPGKLAQVTTLDTSSLESLQKAVNGLIEILYIDDSTILVCNDEGKINGMPVNRSLKLDGYEGIADIICGPFFIVGTGNEEDEDFADLSEEQIAKWLPLYKWPEEVFSIGDKLLIHPIIPYEPKERRL